MTMRRILSTLLLLASGVVATSVAQQEPTPEELAISATQTRQSVFKLLSYNMRPINGMARGTEEYDAAIVERNALRVAALAPMIPELFEAMDTRAFEVKTRARPIVWERLEEFEQKAANLVEAANTFAGIAAQGDRAQTIAAVREFGSNCGNCHDVFRTD